MLISKYFIGSLVVVSMLLSCTKSESYDIQGDPEVKFFANIMSPGNAPQNSISYNVVNIPDVAGSGLVTLSSTVPPTIKFPVLASRPVNEDVIIGAALDNSLIATYNAAHNTKYAEFPAGILNTDGLTAHLSKGASISADSITILSNAAGINTMTGTAYMAPILLKTVSKAGAGVITSNSATQVVYIVVNVEQRRIKFLATTADVIGALATPRTSWTAVFNPAPSTTGNIFDASLTTFSRWTASPVQVDVNMQASKNVTGIRLYSANVATYVPTKIDVYLSKDGINYDLIGSPLKANLTYASSYNYILFYKAIPAQYIRLVLNYVANTNAQNYRVVEFDTYAN